MSIWNEVLINQPVWVSNLSNLTSITVLGAVIGLYRRFNCNQHMCLRIGRHKVDGTTYHTCAKHLTDEFHSALQKQHAHKHPEQHRFLNSAEKKLAKI
jgi:hypothetical protein